MPYTADDAEKYTKKAVTPALSARWAAVATSVLEKCIADGGTDESCAASAITQANGVIAQAVEAEEQPMSDLQEQLIKMSVSEMIVGSLDAYISKVRDAFSSVFNRQYTSGGTVADASPYYWTRDVLSQHPALGDCVVADYEGQMFAVPYIVNDDGTVTFAAPDQWQKVAQTYVLVGDGSADVETEAAPDPDPASVALDENATGRVLELVEAATAPQDRRAPLLLDMVLIEPGWGNTADNHYYPAETLVRDAHVFEGVKMYATDHKQVEKNARSTEVATVQKVVRFTDTGAPVVRVGIHDGDFAEATRNRATLGTLDKLECSIMAEGRARDGFEEGGRKGKWVEAITAGHAVDFVTRAGAGGRALALVESEEGGTMTTAEPERIVTEGSEPEDAAPDAVTEAATDTQPVTIREQDEPERRDVAPVAPALLDEATITTALVESRLPELARAKLAQADYRDRAALDAAIVAERAYIKEITGSGTPFAPASRAATPPVTLTEVHERQDHTNARWGFPAPRAQ